MFRRCIISIVGMIISFMLLGHTPAYSTSSTDISMIGLGARPMGMGKAFTALADDTSALFLNPGGLARLQKPQLLSMHSSLMSDVNYLTFGGNIPWGPGVFGMSLLQSYVDEIGLTELDSNDRPRVTDTVTYFEGIWALAYGVQLNDYLRNTFQWNLSGNMYGGITGKYFHKGVQGMVSAGGTNADIGMLYQHDEKLSYGLVFKNIIPSMGFIGSINWDTGASDPIVSYTTFGVGYRMQPNWMLLLDYDFSFFDKRKALVHFGTEYQLDTYAKLRMGWEQLHDSVGRDTTDHLTMGVSLLVNGLTIDYAYQPFYSIAENTTHFISFCYTFDTPQAPVFTMDETYDEISERHVQPPAIEMYFGGGNEEGLAPAAIAESPQVPVDMTEIYAAIDTIDSQFNDEHELCADYEEAASEAVATLATRAYGDQFTMQNSIYEGAHHAD